MGLRERRLTDTDKEALVPAERRRRIAERIRESGSVTVAMLEE